MEGKVRRRLKPTDELEAFGERHTLEAWLDEQDLCPKGLTVKDIQDRLMQGWTPEMAVSRPKKKGRKSRFRGVTLGSNGKWQAQIKHDNKVLFLGYYEDEVEAAKAFDRKARELRGRSAITNF